MMPKLTHEDKALFKEFAIILILIAFLGTAVFLLSSNLSSPEKVVEFINGFGAVAPIILILLIALEVVIAPIPGFLLSVASGFLFGTVQGTIYTYFGNLLGTSIAFLLARRYGRPLAEKFIKSHKLEVYDCFFREQGKKALWIFYLFPVFPSDIVSFVSGLSTIKWKDFMFIVAIAYIPNMLLLNYFGANLYEYGFSRGTIVGGILLMAAVFLGLFAYFYLRRKTINKCG